MAPVDEQLTQQLREAFRVEAREHMQVMIDGLLALERAPAPDARQALLDSVFRAAHSLKGAARSTEIPEVETRCQRLEDVFAGWKRGESPAETQLDEVHRMLDGLAEALERLAGANATPRSKAAADTVRVPVSKLDARLATAEEMLVLRLAAKRRARELEELEAGFDEWRRQWQPVESRTLLARQARRRGAGAPAMSSEDLAAVLDFLEWNRDHVHRLDGRLAAIARESRRDRGAVFHLVDDLLEESKKLVLAPFGSITAPLPKLVRDLCREQGKDAELVVDGADVEIDRRVLEEIKDPLIHILRNSVDHGVERGAERARRGLGARARIRVALERLDAGKALLRVEDDGPGPSIAAIRTAALERGLLGPAEAAALGEPALLDLAFRTGLSTRREVTAVSGRGLGLSIVREKAERLGGQASIGRRPCGGTVIEVLLPTSLSTCRGVLVRAGGVAFIIPNPHIDRVCRVRPAEALSVKGSPAIRVEGELVALRCLAEVLEIPGRREAAAVVDAVVLGRGETRTAFVVDEVVEELEVLVKPLSPPLIRVRNISGAAALGTGELAPILNAPDVLNSARRSARRLQPAVPAPARSKAILLAEDSITSRMLLRGILEAEGYAVKTAADGFEALGVLRSHSIDLVISDVDMPRLDGFGLTERIRADERFAALPVVLVTTLGSAEHRERGIDAGANAYIVKSGFDQQDLIETVVELLGGDRP